MDQYAESEVQDMIAEIDVGESSGEVDFPEFVNFICRTYKKSDDVEEYVNFVTDELKAAFEYLDVNKDNNISAQDLQEAFASIGENYRMEDVC
jgi:Ca2+-binding EF-hand superfamily protein